MSLRPPENLPGNWIQALEITFRAMLGQCFVPERDLENFPSISLAAIPSSSKEQHTGCSVLVTPLGAAVKGNKPATTMFQNLKAAAGVDIWHGSTAATRHLTPQRCRCTESARSGAERHKVTDRVFSNGLALFKSPWNMLHMLPNEFPTFNTSLAIKIKQTDDDDNTKSNINK